METIDQNTRLVKLADRAQKNYRKALASGDRAMSLYLDIRNDYLKRAGYTDDQIEHRYSQEHGEY